MAGYMDIQVGRPSSEESRLCGRFEVDARLPGNPERLVQLCTEHLFPGICKLTAQLLPPSQLEVTNRKLLIYSFGLCGYRLPIKGSNFKFPFTLNQVLLNDGPQIYSPASLANDREDLRRVRSLIERKPYELEATTSFRRDQARASFRSSHARDRFQVKQPCYPANLKKPAEQYASGSGMPKDACGYDKPRDYALDYDQHLDFSLCRVRSFKVTKKGVINLEAMNTIKVGFRDSVVKQENVRKQKRIKELGQVTVLIHRGGAVHVFPFPLENRGIWSMRWLGESHSIAKGLHKQEIQLGSIRRIFEFANWKVATSGHRNHIESSRFRRRAARRQCGSCNIVQDYNAITFFIVSENIGRYSPQPEGDNFMARSVHALNIANDIDNQPIRIQILGTPNVGKTTLCRQMTTSEFLGARMESISEDTVERCVTVELDSQRWNVLLIDNFGEAGAEDVALVRNMLAQGLKPSVNGEQDHQDNPGQHSRVLHLLPSSKSTGCQLLLDVLVYLLVYAVDDQRSFDYATKVLEILTKKNSEQKSIVILVANKLDLVRNRLISSQKGKRLARLHGCKYFEISTAINHMIDELLVEIILQVKRLKQKCNTAECQDNLSSEEHSSTFCLSKAALARYVRRQFMIISCEDMKNF
ncbi:Rad and Gem related GTP binding protein 1 [Clonorchis sinensis]|uniref:Rad and Gem related GTP binding protein 1 n=1 Tax=Clonorchis sinensis TaxID=79923 RepID=G7YNQ2_CLOSI|nr:Rad and Gem related GTP binding protein 1 [Clonorchis sinensis]